MVDLMLVVLLLVGVPVLATAFIVREAELYKERERNRGD